MLFFLKLVAAMFVALIILALGIYFFVRYKIRKFFSDIADGVSEMTMGTVPPFRIKLDPRDREELDDDEYFMNEEDVKSRVASLKELGFRHVRDYSTDAMLNLSVFKHDQQSTYVAIYDHFAAGTWCDVYRGYEGGGSWTYSTAKDPGLDIMPGKEQRFLPDTELPEVVHQFWNEAPSDGIETIADDQFARYFEKKYADEMNWNIQRGGPTEQEIRRIAEMSGEECTPEVLESIQKQWAMSISSFLGELAIKQFNKDNGVSKREAAEQEHRIIAIHERVPTQQLLESIHEDFYYDPDDDDDDDPDADRWRSEIREAETLRQSANAVETFHKLLDKSGRREQFQQLGAVTKPVAAEIWLGPDEDAYYDNEEEDDEEEMDDFEM